MLSFHLVLFIDEFTTIGPAENDLGKILAALCELPDPRMKRGYRHRISPLLVAMICSLEAGATNDGGNVRTGSRHLTRPARCWRYRSPRPRRR